MSTCLVSKRISSSSIDVEAEVVGRLQLTPGGTQDSPSNIHVKTFRGLILHKHNTNTVVVPRFLHGFIQVTFNLFEYIENSSVKPVFKKFQSALEAVLKETR